MRAVHSLVSHWPEEGKFIKVLALCASNMIYTIIHMLSQGPGAARQLIMRIAI